MGREDVPATVDGLTPEQVWRRVGDAASIGFHLAHLAGSTDRLLTYARGEELNGAQRAALERERSVDEARPPLAGLLDAWDQAAGAALAQLAATPEGTLTEARFVGRARLPSTVLGLLFHAAEHAARHTGQIVTTTRIVRTL